MTDRSAEELEREAERIRSGIVNTAEELRYRMSPGQIVDEVTRYLRDSDSSVALDNLRRQIRENPMALALIGAGIAWLMIGGRRDSSAETRHRAGYDRSGSGLDSRERYESAYAAGARARPGAGAGVHPSGSVGAAGASAAGTVAPGSSYGSSEPLGATGGATGASGPSGSAGGSAIGSPGASSGSSSGSGGSAAAGVASAGAAHPNSPGTSGVAYGPSGGKPSGGPSTGSSAGSGGTSATPSGATGGTSGSGAKPSDTAGVSMGGPGQGVTGVPTGSDASRKPSATDNNNNKPGSQR